MTIRVTSAAGRHSRIGYFQRRALTRIRCAPDVVFHVLVLLTCLTFGVLSVGCESREDEPSTRSDNPPGKAPPGDDPVADPPDDDPPNSASATISAIVPDLASAAGGTIVTVVTDGFSDDFSASAPAVTFAGIASTSVIAMDAVTLTAEVPPLSTGEVDVQVVGSAFTGTAAGFSIVAAAVAGEVIVNEALLNPGGLDANRDGGQSNLDDEFVELVNVRATPVDLSGHTLRDATAIRHTFANPTTLPAGGSLVVFGAGNFAAAVPAFTVLHESGHALGASSGALSLNNGGDTITLAAPSTSIIDTLTFGAGAPGVSLNRNPDGGATAPPGAHPDLADSVADPTTGGGFSPGLRVDQSLW